MIMASECDGWGKDNGIKETGSGVQRTRVDGMNVVSRL